MAKIKLNISKYKEGRDYLTPSFFTFYKNPTGFPQASNSLPI